MRIIPLKNTTLMVLQDLSCGDYSGSVCLVSGSDEIVYYWTLIGEISTLKDIEREIESCNTKTWWRSLEQKKIYYEYLTNVRSIMISYIREMRIDSLFKEEYINEWC